MLISCDSDSPRMDTEVEVAPTIPATPVQQLLGELVLKEESPATLGEKKSAAVEEVSPAAALEDRPPQEPTVVVKSTRGRKRKTQNEAASPAAKATTATRQKRARTNSETEQQCSECDFVTSTRQFLRKHCILNHADKMDPVFLLNQYKCDFCDKVFKDPIQLSNHKNVHLGLKPYKCVECEHTFTTRGELIRHTRYKHTLEKPHKCTECDYSSVELSKLKRHMRVHTDERPYLCLYCDYASRDTFKLKRHIRIHTGEKPYECPECKACFSQSNSLKVHMKNSHEEGSRAQKKKVRKNQQTQAGPAARPVEVKVAVAVTNEELPARAEAPAESTSPASDKAQPRKTAYYLSMDDSYYSNEKYLKAAAKSEAAAASGGDEGDEGAATAAQASTFVQTNVVIEDEQSIHTCQECGMKFASRPLLEEHFIKHSGDRPFKCEVCDRRFGAKFALRSHLLSHDKEYTAKLKSKLKSINDATNESMLLNSTSSLRPLDQSLERSSEEKSEPASLEAVSEGTTSTKEATKGDAADLSDRAPKKRGRKKKA